MSFLVLPAGAPNAPAFSAFAVPAIGVLLLAVILGAMFSYSKDPRAHALRNAARIAIAPMGIVFFAAMALRTLESVAAR